jgi:hypothetical protein
VLAGTVAQRRFGHAISGLIVGLPLTSLPILWFIALQHGVSFTETMTAALLVGSIAEAAVLWIYARLTSQLSPALALGGALAAFALAVVTVNLLGLSPLIAGLFTAVGFAIALRWWPLAPAAPATSTGRSRLALRVIVAALLTFVIMALAGRLGPVWSGLLDALPAMSMMMAFMTHHDDGAGASSGFLRGVTRGSFSYLAAMLVLAETLRTGDLLLAFSGALGAALVVQALIQAFDSLAATTHRSTEGPASQLSSAPLADLEGDAVYCS